MWTMLQCGKPLDELHTREGIKGLWLTLRATDILRPSVPACRGRGCPAHPHGEGPQHPRN
jgi:hypothetical protein